VPWLHQRNRRVGRRGCGLAAIPHCRSPTIPERFVAEVLRGATALSPEYLLAERMDAATRGQSICCWYLAAQDRVNGERAGGPDDRTAPGAGTHTARQRNRENAFVVSLEPARKVVRYHHCSAGLLRLEPAAGHARRVLPRDARDGRRWSTPARGRIVDASRPQDRRPGEGLDRRPPELLADHSFSRWLDGRGRKQCRRLAGGQRTFPRARAGHPELALVEPSSKLVQGTILRQTVAHLAAGEAAFPEGLPPGASTQA